MKKSSPSPSMASIGQKRIQREFREVMGSPEMAGMGMQLELVADNLSELTGTVTGPPDTPYAGGKFQLRITIPENYPFNPPKVQFITKTWHPNVSSMTGAICLDILKDKWSAAMTLGTVLLSVQALLADPNPNDPQDAIVAGQYLGNYPTYQGTAEHWTQVYAGSHHQHPEYDAKVKQLQDMMGVEEEAARDALSRCGWILELLLEEALLN